MADMIRGMEVEKALHLLKFHPKKAYSSEMEKVLLSAAANWQEKNDDEGLDDGELYVKAVTVDGARVLKRIQPAPQGRAHRIRKRYNHITITVDIKGGSAPAATEVASTNETEE